MHLKTGLLAVLVAAAMPIAALAGPINDTTPLDIDGLGPIKIGMKVKDAEKASGIKIKIENDLGDASCMYAHPAKGFDGLSFMISKGWIARIDIADKATNKTAAGAHIGSTEAEIKQLYPKPMKITNEHYGDDYYLTVASADPKQKTLRYVFVTENGKVTGFRSGREPEVEYTEGCD